MSKYYNNIKKNKNTSNKNLQNNEEEQQQSQQQLGSKRMFLGDSSSRTFCDLSTIRNKIELEDLPQSQENQNNLKQINDQSIDENYIQDDQNAYQGKGSNKQRNFQQEFKKLLQNKQTVTQQLENSQKLQYEEKMKEEQYLKKQKNQQLSGTEQAQQTSRNQNSDQNYTNDQQSTVYHKPLSSPIQLRRSRISQDLLAQKRQSKFQRPILDNDKNLTQLSVVTPIKRFSNGYEIDNNEIYRKRFLIKVKVILLSLLARCESYRLKNLQSIHFDIINDLSYYNPDTVKGNQKSLAYRVSKLCCFKKVLKPEQTTCIIFTLISMFFVFTQCLIYTFHIFFGYNYGDEFKIIRSLVLAVMIIDTFISLNLGFYKKGSLIEDREQIIKNYYFKQFYFDLSGFISIIYNHFDISRNIYTFCFEIPFFLKVFQLRYKLEFIEKLFVNSGARSHFYNFWKLILNIALLCHVTAIFYYQLAVFQMDYLNEVNTWLHFDKALDEEWYEKYQRSFYWALSTMMLIGSQGHNFLESWFTTITILLTVGVFAYTISEISNIIEDINKESQYYKDELALINNYLKQKNTSIEIQSQIRNYLEFHHQYVGIKDQKQDIEIILDKLPKQLKSQLKKESHYNLLKEFPIMNYKFSDSILEKLVSVMTEKVYLQNEIIFQQEQTDEVSLYLLYKGEVDLIIQHEQEKVEGLEKKLIETRLHTCKVGDAFGTNGTQHLYTAKCKQSSTVYKILIHDLESIIRGYPTEFEKYKKVKDKLQIIRGIDRILGQACLICKNLTHTEIKCPIIHYQVNANKILQLNYSQVTKERKKNFKRHNILDPQSMRLLTISKSDFSNSNNGAQEYNSSQENQKLVRKQQTRQTIINNRVSIKRVQEAKKTYTHNLVTDPSPSSNRKQSLNIQLFKTDYRSQQSHFSIQSMSKIKADLQEIQSPINILDGSVYAKNEQINPSQPILGKGFRHQTKEYQKFHAKLEIIRLNEMALDFQFNLQEQIDHFNDTEMYKNKTFIQWKEQFQKYNVIQDPSEDQNWYMIWLDEYLVEQQVYCDDIIDEDDDDDDDLLDDFQIKGNGHDSSQQDSPKNPFMNNQTFLEQSQDQSLNNYKKRSIKELDDESNSQSTENAPYRQKTYSQDSKSKFQPLNKQISKNQKRGSQIDSDHANANNNEQVQQLQQQILGLFTQSNSQTNISTTTGLFGIKRSAQKRVTHSSSSYTQSKIITKKTNQQSSKPFLQNFLVKKQKQCEKIHRNNVRTMSQIKQKDPLLNQIFNLQNQNNYSMYQYQNTFNQALKNQNTPSMPVLSQYRRSTRADATIKGFLENIIYQDSHNININQSESYNNMRRMHYKLSQKSQPSKEFNTNNLDSEQPNQITRSPMRKGYNNIHQVGQNKSNFVQNLPCGNQPFDDKEKFFFDFERYKNYQYYNESFNFHKIFQIYKQWQTINIKIIQGNIAKTKKLEEQQRKIKNKINNTMKMRQILNKATLNKDDNQESQSRSIRDIEIEIKKSQSQSQQNSTQLTQQQQQQIFKERSKKNKYSSFSGISNAQIPSKKMNKTLAHLKNKQNNDIEGDDEQEEKYQENKIQVTQYENKK